MENEALGAASYFNQVFDEYSLYPEATWLRLYLDALQEVLQHPQRVFVVEGGGGGPIPLLDLLKKEGGE